MGRWGKTGRFEIFSFSFKNIHNKCIITTKFKLMLHLSYYKFAFLPKKNSPDFPSGSNRILKSGYFRKNYKHFFFRKIKLHWNLYIFVI
jgi:hypothetical protein